MIKMANVYFSVTWNAEFYKNSDYEFEINSNTQTLWGYDEFIKHLKDGELKDDVFDQMKECIETIQLVENMKGQKDTMQNALHQQYIAENKKSPMIRGIITLHYKTWLSETYG